MINEPRPAPAREQLPLTDARSRLFQLAGEILSGDRECVVLTSRGANDALVLLTLSQLNQLEEELRMLREKLEVPLRPLKGLGKALATVEESIALIRAEQGTLASDKLERIFYESAPKELKRVAEPSSQNPGFPARKRKGR